MFLHCTPAICNIISFFLCFRETQIAIQFYTVLLQFEIDFLSFYVFQEPKLQYYFIFLEEAATQVLLDGDRLFIYIMFKTNKIFLPCIVLIIHKCLVHSHINTIFAIKGAPLKGEG
jgi:hypothetical protein